VTAPDVPQAPPVAGFIVGTSRGGTTFMNKVMNLHPQVTSFGESAFFGRLWREPRADGTYTRQQVADCLDNFRHCRWGPSHGGNVGTLPDWVGLYQDRWVEHVDRLAAEADLPRDGVTPGDVFGFLCRCMTEATGRPIVVEKTPHHLGSAARIDRYFPEAKYVLMIRDPYKFARSYKNQGRQFGEGGQSDFKNAYHPITVALLWRGYARQALLLQSQRPGRVLRVTLDDLREDEAGVLDGVQRHFGLDPIDMAGKVAPDNSSTAGGGVAELDTGEIWWINRLAGSLIPQLGFECREDGSPATAARYAATWPAWGVRNLSRYRGQIEGSLLKYAWRYLRPR
jgi:hypothetical protein